MFDISPSRIRGRLRGRPGHPLQTARATKPPPIQKLRSYALVGAVVFLAQCTPPRCAPQLTGAPAAAPPTTPVPPRPGTVGVPSNIALAPMASSQVAPGGVYENVVITGQLEIGTGQPATTFKNCLIEGSMVTYSTIIMESCTVHGGLYSYDTGGSITRTLIDTANSQGFRPGTTKVADNFTLSTPWVVTDSYIRVTKGAPGAHVEAAQVLGGVGITFRNVVFETGGPFNNTQTADLNFIGKDMLCEDCSFVGYGGYAIYSEGQNNVFLRPKFARNYQWGILFPTARFKATIIDPKHLDGTPA